MQKLLALSEEQRDRLLTLRAAWEEGEDEERLERLRLREEDAETVRAFSQLLADTNFADDGNLTRAQMAHLLSLARALAPNPNLDARLLHRPDEPAQMNHDLRELLNGNASLALRLRGFLSRRHAGGQTAMQLLCAHQPETWPLVTQAGLRALQLSPEQQQIALQTARERFDLPDEVKGVESYSNRPVHIGVPNNDPILRLLADVVVYEAACETLQASDYLAVHRLLTRGLSARSARSRQARVPFYPPTSLAEKTEGGRRKTEEANPEARSPNPESYSEYRTPTFLHEPQADYHAEAAPPVDITGVTQSQLLAEMEREIVAQGFTYPALTVRDYYLCLQSKPFVLLSGLSGTGKTRLTALFAHALNGEQSEQYRLLPVRPDWNDSAPLLGYVNLLVSARDGRGTFVGTPFLDFLLRASHPDNAHRTFFLCLDEMNLARVEHYFAEILSAMETPGRELLLPDGRITRLPANLFLTGTLNLDEATHSLSRKVLDRANTLTFQDVSLREDPFLSTTSLPPEAALSTQDEQNAATARKERIAPAVRQALFLQTRVRDVGEARRKLRTVSPTGMDFATQTVNLLADVNALLEPHGLHVAYRVRDEALRYCANSFDVDGQGLLSPDAPDDAVRNLQTALDLQLAQKVLPRLTGSGEQLDAPVADLLRYVDKHPFEQTARRLRRMQARLQRDGFTSFDAV